MGRIAILGVDYLGLKPKMLVDLGRKVGLGEPLFFDKRDPNVRFTSPGTGQLIEINRGHRRLLQSVVIELDEQAGSEVTFDPPFSQDPQSIRDLLWRSGAWTGFRTRPYNRVAPSSSSPHSIFVTATDTSPLAADPDVVIRQYVTEFQYGVQIIEKLGDWPVFVCTGPNWPDLEYESDRIRRVKFDGPHPAGLVGTHIHHLDPVSANRMVWHIGYQDVIGIGHLFLTGQILTERVISIAGPGVLSPRLIRTRHGVDINELLTDELAPGSQCRLISGSVLDGFMAEGPLAYLGRYHNQISVLPENPEHRLFGWFGSGQTGKSRRDFNTARNGRRASMIPIEAFENIMPLNLLPIPLLRAILVKDTDAAKSLGCMELAEEDLALFSYFCAGKQDYGTALRLNLEQIEKES